LREIRRLIIAGVPHQDIQRQLGLAEKTYYRYLDAAFKEDRERLAESVTTDEMLTQITITEERLTEMYRNMREIATNENFEPAVRIMADNAAGEVAMIIMKLRAEAPAAVINGTGRRLQYMQQKELEYKQKQQQQG